MIPKTNLILQAFSFSQCPINSCQKCSEILADLDPSRDPLSSTLTATLITKSSFTHICSWSNRLQALLSPQLLKSIISVFSQK